MQSYREFHKILMCIYHIYSRNGSVQRIISLSSQNACFGRLCLVCFVEVEPHCGHVRSSVVLESFSLC